MLRVCTYEYALLWTSWPSAILAPASYKGSLSTEALAMVLL